MPQKQYKITPETEKKFEKYKKLSISLYSIVNLICIGLALTALVYITSLLTKRNTTFESSINLMINLEFLKYLKAHKYIIGILIGFLILEILNRITNLYYDFSQMKTSLIEYSNIINWKNYNSKKARIFILGFSNAIFLETIFSLLFFRKYNAQKPSSVCRAILTMLWSAFITVFTKLLTGFILAICLMKLIEILKVTQQKDLVMILLTIISLMAAIFLFNIIIDILFLCGKIEPKNYHHFVNALLGLVIKAITRFDTKGKYIYSSDEILETENEVDGKDITEGNTTTHFNENTNGSPNNSLVNIDQPIETEFSKPVSNEDLAKINSDHLKVLTYANFLQHQQCQNKQPSCIVTFQKNDSGDISYFVSTMINYDEQYLNDTIPRDRLVILGAIVYRKMEEDKQGNSFYHGTNREILRSAALIFNTKTPYAEELQEIGVIKTQKPKEKIESPKFTFQSISKGIVQYTCSLQHDEGYQLEFSGYFYTPSSTIKIDGMDKSPSIMKVLD